MTRDLGTLLITQGWGLALLRGGLMTIVVGALGMALGVLAALPLAVVRWQRLRVASTLVDGYSLLVRSIPGLLVVYLLFFGTVESFERVATAFGFETIKDAFPFCVGVFSIAVISCAYSIEVLRGALDAVPSGLIEAARVLALPRSITFLKVTAPLALRNAVGGMNNVWQMTIKDTSLVSVVGLQEVLRVAAIASGISRSPLIFYVIAALMYFAITGVSQWGFGTIERRLDRGFGGR